MRRAPHYLRSERRKRALLQREIAALLGVRSTSKVRRYEAYQALPPLRTAFAYEVIYGKPLTALFPDLFKEVRQEVMARASLLRMTKPDTASQRSSKSNAPIT